MNFPAPIAIPTPTGRWHLVGSVPARAAYERKDGQPLTEEDIQAISHCGAGIIRWVRARTYLTKELAESTAKAEATR